MFTGLVQDIGTVRTLDKSGDWHVTIETALDLAHAPAGASIMCGGVCLTAVETGQDWFSATISHETLSKTNIHTWEEGTRINLEPSLRLGDELGGHFVFGHVDGLAGLVDIEDDHDSKRLHIAYPDQMARFIAAKGSVSLDGISLTVNEVQDDFFTVNIVPHTWEHTTLQYVQTGDSFNFEADMLARYVMRLSDMQAAA